MQPATRQLEVTVMTNANRQLEVDGGPSLNLLTHNRHHSPANGGSGSSCNRLETTTTTCCSHMHEMSVTTPQATTMTTVTVATTNFSPLTPSPSSPIQNHQGGEELKTTIVELVGNNSTANPPATATTTQEYLLSAPNDITAVAAGTELTTKVMEHYNTLTSRRTTMVVYSCPAVGGVIT